MICLTRGVWSLPDIQWVNVLARSPRPGYPATRVNPHNVEEWIEVARFLGIESILCLLSKKELTTYYEHAGDPPLLQRYREAGFQVYHVPCKDYQSPPLNQRQAKAVLAIYRTTRKPMLIHCSAGCDRTGCALDHIYKNGNDTAPHQV